MKNSSDEIRNETFEKPTNASDSTAACPLQRARLAVSKTPDSNECSKFDGQMTKRKTGPWEFVSSFEHSSFGN